MRRVKQSGLKLQEVADAIGSLLVDAFHFLALFVIGATTVWAAIVAFSLMVEEGHATIQDILLLFIYLELGAMVGIYFKTNHMPVRFLIYIAITALTRLLIESISVEHKIDYDILIVSGGILILSAAVLILRFGTHKYPSITPERARGSGHSAGSG